MNVYIVEEQMVCLSDYEIQNECWIIGVFKDKKKAEEYIKNYNPLSGFQYKTDKSEIVEEPNDPDYPNLNRTVRINNCKYNEDWEFNYFIWKREVL